MKGLFFLLLLSTFAISSCKEQSINKEIPFTSLADLSADSDFSFSIKSSTIGRHPILPEGANNASGHFVVINDENTYLDEIMTQHKHPFIDFSTHTLLTLGLSYRGSVTLKPRNEGGKTILKVIKEIPELGPQGVIFSTFSAIVPKVDSANVIVELIEINVK